MNCMLRNSKCLISQVTGERMRKGEGGWESSRWFVATSENLARLDRRAGFVASPNASPT